MKVVKVSCLGGSGVSNSGLGEWMTWLERRRQTFLSTLSQPVG
jgi:hypothetical protein